MLAYAEQVFSNTETMTKGADKGAHLRQLAKSKGIAPSAYLGDLKCPTEYLWYWSMFLKLHTTRPIGMTAGAIQYTEILSYCKLNDLRLVWWEVDIIKKLDHTFLKANRDARPSTT